MYFGAITWLLLALPACIPPSDPVYEGVGIELKDELTRRIYEFQDQRLTDSLRPYFSHENPSYRYLSALALGSYSDPNAQEGLKSLLSDPYDLVRAAAAYALGQQGDPELGEALLRNFAPDTSGRFPAANEAILAAIGKTATQERLEQLATVTQYFPRDTALVTGQAWSIFYFGRRGLIADQGTNRALELASNRFPASARYPALAYLSRFVSFLTPEQSLGLIQTFSDLNSSDLRMLQALAIAKDTSDGARTSLIAQLERESDWRVKVNILRGLRNYPYPSVRASLIEQLSDGNGLVSLAAAESILAIGSAKDATTYWTMGRDSFPWRTAYTLYAAANRYLPLYFADYRGSINYQLQQRFQKTDNPYQKAGVISALGEFPWNYRIIQELGFNADAAVVKSAAVRALAAISQREDFNAFFRLSSRRVRSDLSLAFKQAIESGDAGMIYEATQALSVEDTPYTNFYPDLSWARTVLQNLPLPEAVESYRALENAILVLEGKAPKTDYPAPAFNRPIDWKAIDDAGENPTVRIRTAKGNIDLELWPEMAPGTVSSFLQLATSGFFDGKPYHRVVPNFVVQGGDPRGDGYGATDFSLRTETPPFHWMDSGIIGMASAGRDTEGVQFFLTHSGTPHLDGNYTAFGRVIAGQNILDGLRVGDRIDRVEIR